MVSIRVTLTEGPLARDLSLGEVPGCGAQLKFEGLVRPTEGGQQITGLQYEAYGPMAIKVLEELARKAIDKFPGVRIVDVHHSIGFVPNNTCSFTLLIGAAHRKESLAAADWFIDEMKRDVPIWKTAIFAGKTT